MARRNFNCTVLFVVWIRWRAGKKKREGGIEREKEKAKESDREG